MKAFPVANMEGNSDDLGMDLRDYFAAKVMNIFISNDICLNNGEAEWAATVCYYIADAMMEARKK